MGYVTGQTFQETVDGVNTLFTTSQSFDSGSIQVFQGNLALTPQAILEISTTQIRTLDPESHLVWTSDVADTVHSVAHNLAVDTRVVVWSTESGGLPTGLIMSVIHYVLAVDADNIQLSLSQGGAAVTFPIISSGILYIAKPYAPLLVNGTLWYNANFLGTIPDSSVVIGFWNISTWQAQYAQSISLSTIFDLLTDADEQVQDYVTEASYALAETLVIPFRLFRRVIGELAFFYLLRRPGGLQQITSSTKQYGDAVKKMTQQYQVSASTLMEMSERVILSQLIVYRKPSEEEAETTTKPMTHTWGTGRNFGLPVAGLWGE